MDSGTPQPKRRPLRTMAVIFASVFVVGSLFRLTTAGDLAPSATPTPPGTMASLASISDALTGSSYDSSGVVADEDGNAFEITKCIIEKMTGGACI